MKYIDTEKLRTLLVERYNAFQIGQHSPFRNGKVESLRETIELIDSLRQEQPEVELEKASRNVYESWKGGSMDDFLRDMVELGKALNARKEE